MSLNPVETGDILGKTVDYIMGHPVFFGISIGAGIKGKKTRFISVDLGTICLVRRVAS